MIKKISIVALFFILSACQGGGKLFLAEMPGDRYGFQGDMIDVTMERATSDQEQDVAHLTSTSNPDSFFTAPAPVALPTGYRDLTPTYDGKVQEIVTSENDICSAPYGGRRSAY